MKDLITTLGPCNVCEQEPGVGVASIPGIALSVTWGRTCLGVAECIGPFDIHLSNLASFLIDDLEEADLESADVIQCILDAIEGGAVAPWALQGVVFHDGAYKTMHDALKDERNKLDTTMTPNGE
jgi:hypothetical protein